MTRAAWRIPRSPALLAVALVVGLPAVVNAQLFPNINVKRPREACVQEPPFNAHVRRDYFGYYPTCWSRFPAGWACPCPNPEMPNAAESFRKQPRDKPSGIAEPGMEPGMDEPEAPGDMPADPDLPPMPNQGRSPFDLDNKAPAPAPAPPDSLDEPSAPPRGAIPSPRSGDAGPAPAPESGLPSTTGLLEMPKLPTPTTSNDDGVDSLPLPDEAMLASASGNAEGSPVHANLGPLPAPRSLSAPVDSEIPTSLAPYSAKAPARKSILGGLFSNMSNRRRR